MTGKLKVLEISENVWKKIIQTTSENIFRLLDSAEKLLKCGGSKEVCAGLYTYAVEEFGKLLYLQECVPTEGKVKVEYAKKFTNHDFKFWLALKNLPNECKIIHEGSFSPEYFNEEDFDVDVTADFKARLAIFYSDFTKSGNDVLEVPMVDESLLEKAIDYLRKNSRRKT